MRVNFLGASDGTPLSKTFEEIAPGTYREESYPHVANFVSVERDVSSLQDFFLQIQAAAKEGLCLLKGTLDRPLINESRAGHTSSSDATPWICLDVDYTVTEQAPDEWLDALSPEFEGVSFIFQRSASMGIKSDLAEGWRGHFFILLESPLPPPALKQWLIQRNLVCSPLQTNVGLSASGGALLFPLDVTTCQNDKLLYIAPPRCIGFVDPVPARFMWYQRDHEAVSLDLSEVNAATNQEMSNALIAKLRKAKGLKAKRIRTTTRNSTEILTNPDPVTVTGVREARGFVYLNLNGGDSWAYFFHPENPEILYNFKGEPAMFMKDVSRELLEEYRPTKAPTKVQGSEPFGFLWPDDDTYYRGFANRETRELEWLKPVGSKAKLRDFFVQHGCQPDKQWAVDEWNLIFDPSEEGYADFNKQEVNTFRRSEYITNARTIDTGYIPPTIDRVLTSVCVNDETKAYFLNWLAFVFQTRQKTNTAWIFQGVQGTGKGVLFSRILVPIIGHQYCHEMTMDRLDDDFNAYLSDNILLFIDEAKISDSRGGDRLLNRVKNLITEPEQHIRGMRRNAVTRRNFSNIILASNYDEILPIEASDRRFNVAPRQEKPVRLDYDDIARIEGELQDFADFLHSYSVDSKNVRTVMLSEARERLINLSETTVMSFFHALMNGDLAYFTQYIDSSIKADIEGIQYQKFAEVVERWMEHAEQGKSCNISRVELRTVYQFLQSATISATKFTRMCSKHGFEMKPVRIDGKVQRGIRGINWDLKVSEIEEYRDNKQSNSRGTVIPLHKEK